MSILGTRVIRTEDPRLLTSGGVYVDDVREPELAGAVRATFVRSTVAHALITGIDTSAALAQPGVVAVLTVADMTDMPDQVPPEPEPEGAPPAEGPMPLGGVWSEPLLAVDRVRFVGEPVALVLTDSAYQGEDAAELVSVDYEPLPAVASIEAALAGKSLLYPEAGTNVCVQGRGEVSDDSIFDGCEVIVEGDVVNQRVACLPMEGRSTAAAWVNGKLTVWASTQNAQIARLILTAIGLPPEAIRVVAPDVGGGFGAKIGIDRESIIVAWAAKHTGRPVRWVETRSENLVAMTQGRAQLHHIKIGGSKRRAHQGLPARCRPGHRRVPADVRLPADADQPDGAGRLRHPRRPGRATRSWSPTRRRSPPTGAPAVPEAAATIERAVDWYAAEAGVDPARGAQAQLHQEGAVPVRHQDGRALRHRRLRGAPWTRCSPPPATRNSAPSSSAAATPGDTRQLGIGLASYVEITAADAAAGETAKVEVHDDGTATVYTGSSAHGQGHHTAFAMLVTAELGIPMDKIEVIHGDTDLIPDGIGTYASRSLQLGGSAVQKAAIEVKDEAAKKAAELFEAAESDVVLDAETGTWHIVGDPDKSLTWSQVASAADAGADRGQRAVHRRPADVPVRHASVAGRGRRRDRQGHAAAARHRRRRGTGAQPDPARGPAARRHRPGRGAGAVRGDPLRRRRQPADLHARGLRRDHRGRAAQLRAAHKRDADPGEPAGRQGHRRGRHDRGHPGRAQRGDRRRVAPRRPAHRHADDAGTCVDRYPEGGAESERGVKVELTVNGKDITADVEDRTLLVHFLRDTADLTATNIGCDTTSCGACTVLLDGESVKSCTVLAAQADGRSVTTLEGLASDSGEMHPVQRAFHTEHGLQCGYCTPGMVMAIVSLLKENPSPTEAEVRIGP